MQDVEDLLKRHLSQTHEVAMLQGQVAEVALDIQAMVEEGHPLSEDLLGEKEELHSLVAQLVETAE